MVLIKGNFIRVLLLMYCSILFDIIAEKAIVECTQNSVKKILLWMSSNFSLTAMYFTFQAMNLIVENSSVKNTVHKNIKLSDVDHAR